MAYEDEQQRLEQLEKQRSLKGFSGGALDQYKKYEKFSAKEKFNQAKGTLKNSSKAVNSVKQAENMASAYKAIDLSRDAPWLIVIVFSILADLFTLIPIVGSALALVFSVFFWFYYLISGHYKKRAAVKAIITGATSALEILGIGLNMLPFFTASAIINYWLILAERKGEQTQK